MIEKIMKNKEKYIGYLVGKKRIAKDDAEDLFQDALLVCTEKQVYDIPLFIECLKNISNNFIRDSINKHTVDINMELIPERTKDSSVNTEKLISLFNGRAKSIVKLRLDGLSYKEIENITGIKANCLNITVMSAIKKIDKKKAERILNG